MQQQNWTSAVSISDPIFKYASFYLHHHTSLIFPLKMAFQIVIIQAANFERYFFHLCGGTIYQALPHAPGCVCECLKRGTKLSQPKSPQRMANNIATAGEKCFRDGAKHCSKRILHSEFRNSRGTPSSLVLERIFPSQ